MCECVRVEDVHVCVYVKGLPLTSIIETSFVLTCAVLHYGLCVFIVQLAESHNVLPHSCGNEEPSPC